MAAIPTRNRGSVALKTSTRQELFERHWPLARSLAKRFAGRGEEVDDLLQVAAVGLMKAVDRFDPSLGNTFATYAAPTITGEIRRHFRTLWSVHVSRSVQESYAAVSTALERLSQHLGRAPTVGEIAMETGLAERDVVSVLEAGHCFQTGSIDALEDRDAGSAHPATGDDEFDRVHDRVMLGPAFEALSLREKRIVYLRFYEGLMQSEIGKRIGISQMHVSRLLAEALSTVRAELERTVAANEPSVPFAEAG